VETTSSIPSTATTAHKPTGGPGVPSGAADDDVDRPADGAHHTDHEQDRAGHGPVDANDPHGDETLGPSALRAEVGVTGRLRL